MAKKNFKTNEKILIQLKKNHKQYESEFFRETLDGIEVKNSKDLSTGKIYKHVQTFFNSEIEKLLPLGEPSQRTEANEQPSSQRVQHKSIVNRSYAQKTFSDAELEHMKNLIKKKMYISQFDDTYHNAVKDIQQQKIVSVYSENRFGRLDLRRPLIAIATSNQVYLFDILLLGMKKELKQIFSSETPRKIVHSVAQLADYLQHNESCSINNAFDTLMVHFNLQQTREPISFIDCFKIYFELPTDFILQKFDYQIRPLSHEALFLSAFNVLLLEHLYWYFNDILMKPLHIATQQFSVTCVDVDNQVDLMNHMNYNRFPGIENIDLNAVVDLEEAFKNLNSN